MNAVAMVADCQAHQWPELFGRAAITDPLSLELEAVTPLELYECWAARPAYDTWCDRCACDHGIIPRTVEYETEPG